MDMERIGWNETLRGHLETMGFPGCIGGRVTCEHRGGCVVLTALGELQARASGRLLHRAHGREDLPAVGGWVAVESREREQAGTIHAVLPRRSCFCRTAVGGRTERQVLAANVDTCFLVSGLGANFNLRRIERYLSAAWESGAQPVVVLNKADLVDEPAAFVVVGYRQASRCVCPPIAPFPASPVPPESSRNEEGTAPLPWHTASADYIGPREYMPWWCVGRDACT